MAFPAQLLIAKVVAANGSISTTAESRAIHWAVDNGARVINLSLGGLRDPFQPRLDLYSPLEQDAVDYAVRKGAVVVAAVGNGDDAPGEPWPYASYPAALPHVLGVSALTESGAVPAFSDRDAIYNDVSAPGADILSTFPRALTAKFPACTDQGYSDCGDPDYRRGEGTSFAAPQVSAAAALLLAARPSLTPIRSRTVCSSTRPTTSTPPTAAASAPRCATRCRAGAGSTSRRSTRSAGSLPAPDRLRDERRRRRSRVDAARLHADDPGHARLLGRSDRRVPDLPAQGPEALLVAGGPGAHPVGPPALAARHDPRRRPHRGAARSRAATVDPGRLHVHRAGGASLALRRAAGTTSRRRSRRPASGRTR